MYNVKWWAHRCYHLAKCSLVQFLTALDASGDYIRNGGLLNPLPGDGIDMGQCCLCFRECGAGNRAKLLQVLWDI
jgi:hypothetical protein